MQVFGFGKKRPTVNNGVVNFPNGYNEAPVPISADQGRVPLLNGYSPSPAPSRGPLQELPLDSRTPVTASVGSTGHDLETVPLTSLAQPDALPVPQSQYQRPCRNASAYGDGNGRQQGIRDTLV